MKVTLMPNNKDLKERFKRFCRTDEAADNLVEAIEQLIREARIDEIQTHRGFDMITDKPAGIVMTHKEVEDRLEQLKAGERR